MHTRLFIYSRSEAESPHAVAVRLHALRWQRQGLQQRQANIHVHNVKRFATLASPMSFRCHGGVIIDVSIFVGVILGAKQIVHTRYSPLATSTLRISFRCHMGANCCRIDISGSPVASGLLQRALHHLKFTNRGKYRNKKTRSLCFAPRPSSAILFIY